MDIVKLKERAKSKLERLKSVENKEFSGFKRIEREKLIDFIRYWFIHRKNMF